MNTAAVLRVIVEAQTGAASANLAKFDGQLQASAAKADAAMGGIASSAKKAETAGKRMEATGRSITKAGKAIGLATAPLALFGAASVKMSLDFKRQMGLVATDAGGTAKEVHRLEHSVLGLSRASQYGPTQLAESLFHVESSGYRGAKAMRVLNEAQKLATTGNSDLQSTTYALISATKSLYGDSLTNVNRTAAELNGIVAHGDMRLEELTSAMATGVIPKAKAMGLDLRDVGAAMDVMTARGIPAQRAAYALGFTMQKLVPYGEKAEDAFKSIGLGEETLVKAAKGPGGYVHTLEVLQHHLAQLPTQVQRTKLIEEMFGGGRMTSGLLTDLQNLGEMRKIYGELGHEIGIYSRHVKEAEEQPLVKLKRSWSSIQASMTEIGGDLLPIIVPGFEHIVHLADGAMHAFTGLPPELQSAAVEAGLIGVGLSATLITTGKVVEAIGTLRTSMLGLAAVDAASSLGGIAGDLKAAGGLTLGGEMGGFRMVGADAAGALMGGLTRALPPLAAAAGVGNVVYTASKGDWDKAGAEAGGAVIGGLAGALVGSAIPVLGTGVGAMLGTGIGSGLGGELDSLFSSEKHLTGFQIALAGSAGAVKHAMEGEQESLQQVHAANQRMVAIGKHQARVRHELGNAEQHLEHLRSKGAGAGPLAHAEGHILILRRRLIRLTQQQDEAERKQGDARKAFMGQAKFTVATQKERIGLLEEEAQKAKKALAHDEKTHASTKQLEQDYRRWNRVLKESSEEQGKLQETLKEAGQAIGPKFEKYLRSTTSWTLRTGKSFDLTARSLGSLAPGIQTAGSLFKKFGEHGFTAGQRIEHSTKGAKEAVHNAAGPMASDLGRIGTGYSNLEKTASTALGNLGSKTSSLAKALGAPAIHFSLQGAGVQKKQHGGFIVPGTGSGDSFATSVPANSFVLNGRATSAFGFQHGGHVPVMLEPGERVFMPHEVSAMGAGNLAAMNAAVPRFQKGGSLGPEPRIAGPSGALRGIGQAAIHQVYEGAKHYLSQHQGLGGVAVPGGGGSVIAQIARVLFANGFNKIGAAGIIGNAYRESGWNPAAVGTGGGGLWGFTSGAISLAALQAAAKRAGVPWTDVPFQTGFMLRHGGMGLRGSLNSAGSAGEAARIFMEQWERPGIPALGDREAGARKALAMGYQRGGYIGPNGSRSKWDGWDATGTYHRPQHLAKGGAPKGPKTGSPSDAVAWAMHHLGSTDQWGYPGEWCGAFIAADMKAQHLPVPSGYPSAASWAGYGSPLGRNNVQAGAILDYGSAHVALAISTSKQIQGNDIHGQVGTSGIGGIIGGSPLTAVRWPPYGTAPGAGGSFSEKVPAVFHGARTHSLSFGAIPKSIPGVEKEIARRERELRVYRHAAAAASGAPATQQAIQHNVTALEKRLSELRRARHKLRQEAAKKRFSRHIGRALARVTGYETLIEGKQRTYTEANEFASQLVDLEPQEAILPATASQAEKEAAERSYVANYSNYVNSQEAPAYQRVLASEADWRNTILRAEIFGFGKGKPSASKLEHGWEASIRSIERKVDRINKESKSQPKSKAAQERLAKEREQLPMLRYKERELRSKLGEARASFYPGVKDPVQPPTVPLAGTGTFEGNLIDVQGTHWPDQHGLIGVLPSVREKGRFGGAIWDTQSTISELGIKVAQAAANLGGSGEGDSGKGEREQLLEELLLHANEREALAEIERKTLGGAHILPYAGGYAAGGVVSAVVGEKGPEIAAFPTGTRIHSASESASMLKPQVVINGDVLQAPGDTRPAVEVDGVAVEAIVNRMDRRGARNARRGMARPGA